MKPESNSWKIWLGMITVYIVWGSTYLAIRFAVETMPPFLMAAARFLIAGAILYTWRRWITRDIPATKNQWRSAAIVGLFLLVGGNGGVVWAETRVPSSIAALVVATTPLWMVIIDAVRPKNRIMPAQGTIVGVLVGLVGILVLVGPQQFFAGGGIKFQSTDLDLLGVGALLLAAFSWSIGSIFSRNADLPGSPLLGTGMEMLSGGFGLLMIGTLSGEWASVELAQISSRSWLGFAYLVIFGAVIGFSAYTWLLRVAPTPLVSTYAYVNPLIAVLLGFLLAGEEMNLQIIVGGLIIISSVALINNTRMKLRTRHNKSADKSTAHAD